MLKLGAIFQASLLFVNAIAVLSEDRFLARIGWVSSSQAQAAAAANAGYHQGYDQGYGNPQYDVGMKAKLIDLITAVRTLMRIPLIGINILVILYSLIW
ncbi:hypothetical protein AX16_003134 [Volvariella volvacea WC 439]|nr:hypothetical protein AX16_003134 [Volvariella volvacea WC 439]